MTPVVSVVLPCLNAEATVGEAIESICAQTMRTWELLVFDDGSTDRSASIVRSLGATNRRIRLIRSDHVGIVKALQRGCRKAQGRYIARMDADDVALPTRLAKQAALLETDPRIALCGTLVEMWGGKVGPGRRRYEAWMNRLVTHEEMVRELFVECPLAHPTFMVRRETFEAVGGYEDHGWAEDYDLCMRLFCAGARFAKVPEPLVRWRETPNRLSNIDTRYSDAAFRALKRHYLLRSHLANRRDFYQWGAGEVGKKWLQEWSSPRPTAVVDINPRKIGRTIHGIRVIRQEDLPPPGMSLILVAVGAPGARDDIRGRLGAAGYLECRDYVFVA